MPMMHTFLPLAVLFCVTTLTACKSSSSSQGSAPEALILSRTFSESGEDLRFDRYDARGRIIIPVCWEEPSDQPGVGGIAFDERSRRQLEQIVRGSYEQPPLNFVLPGWSMCKPGEQESIHIKPNYSIIDATECLGDCMKSLLGKQEGVKLNFAPVPDHPNHQQKVDGGIYLWTAITGLHEFSHVLGLYHEHIRKDRTEPMNEDGAGYIGIGDYDPDSISNYLSNRRDQKNGKMSRLSQGDIRGLLALYHRVQTTEHGTVYTMAQPAVDRHYEDDEVTANSHGRYAISFSVPKTPYYRFKYGPVDKIDCKIEQGYSKVFGGLEITKIDVTELASGTIFKVCVLGGASRTIDASYWQDKLAATQLIFKKAG